MNESQFRSLALEAYPQNQKDRPIIRNGPWPQPFFEPRSKTRSTDATEHPPRRKLASQTRPNRSIGSRHAHQPLIDGPDKLRPSLCPAGHDPVRGHRRGHPKQMIAYAPRLESRGPNLGGRQDSGDLPRALAALFPPAGSGAGRIWWIRRGGQPPAGLIDALGTFCD